MVIVLLQAPIRALGSWERRGPGVIGGCDVALLVGVAGAEIQRRRARPSHPEGIRHGDR